MNWLRATWDTFKDFLSDHPHFILHLVLCLAALFIVLFGVIYSLFNGSVNVGAIFSISIVHLIIAIVFVALVAIGIWAASRGD